MIHDEDLKSSVDYSEGQKRHHTECLLNWLIYLMNIEMI